MSVLLMLYPKCSTCQKAKAWLLEQNVVFTERHIVEENPTAEEIAAWCEKGNLDIKKFFNTSGQLYRELQLKDKLPGMTTEEKLALLATNGMLVKRPILVTDKTVCTGFRAGEWENALQ